MLCVSIQIYYQKGIKLCSSMVWALDAKANSMHMTTIVNTSFLALNNLVLRRWKMFMLKKNHTIILAEKKKKKQEKESKTSFFNMY